MSPHVPPDVFRRGMRVLGVAIREEPRIFTVAVLGSALYGAMTIGQAYAYGAIVDRVVLPSLDDGDVTTAALVTAVLVMLGIAVLKSAGIVARRVFAGVMQYRLQATYRRRVTRQYLRLPLSWHQQHPTGQLLSNANADVEATWYPIAPFPFAVGVIVMLAISAVTLLLTDWVLALVGFLVFPAIAFVNVMYQRRLSPLATTAQQLRAEVSGIAHESFDGALVVKTLGRERSETDRFDATSTQLRDRMVEIGRVRGLFDPVMEALPSLGVLAVLWVGTDRIAAGSLTAEELVRVAYLFTLLALPVRAIGWVLGELPRSVVGWDRVTRVLEATGELPYGEQTAAAGEDPTAVEVAGVAFAYADNPVLDEVDFDVPPGRTVAIVGPTGAGKSTLASLLVRLVDPAGGTVRYDGIDLRTLAPGEVSAVASVVPQQTFVFADTVRGNVTLGAPYDDESVWQALRLAQAERFVSALPQGLDTLVGERGTTLSGGQRQRLALARALIRRPRLLVLDDATSSVDPSVEGAILRGLHDADLPSTVVVVAYRRATIALADEVGFIAGGRVVDRGPHDEQVARQPAYNDLVTAYETAERERAERAAAEAADAAAEADDAERDKEPAA